MVLVDSHIIIGTHWDRPKVVQLCIKFGYAVRFNCDRYLLQSATQHASFACLDDLGLGFRHVRVYHASTECLLHILLQIDCESLPADHVITLCHGHYGSGRKDKAGR